MSGVISKNKVFFVMSRVILVSLITFVLGNLPFFDLGKKVALIILSFLIVHALITRLERRPFEHIGLSVQKNSVIRALLIGFLLGGGLVTGVVFVQWVIGALKVDHFLWESNVTLVYIPALGLVTQFGTAFWEEIFMRGYLLSVLRDKINRSMAILVSSITFALLHFIFTPGPFIVLVNLSLLGILCALYTLHYKNLWIAIGIHFGWNWVQYHGLPVLRGSTMSMGMVNFVESKDFAWYLIGNVEYGIEAAIITTLALFSGILLGRRLCTSGIMENSSVSFTNLV